MRVNVRHHSRSSARSTEPDLHCNTHKYICSTSLAIFASLPPFKFTDQVEDTLVLCHKEMPTMSNDTFFDVGTDTQSTVLYV